MDWFEKVFNFLKEGFTNIIDKLGSVADTITSALSDMLTSLVTNIKDVPVKIRTALIDVRDTLKSVLNLIVSGISDLADTIISWFKDLISNVKSLPSTIKDLFLDMLKYLFIPSDNNLSKCQDLINTKFNFINYFADEISSFLHHDFSDIDNFSLSLYGLKFNLLNWSWIDETLIKTVRSLLAGMLYLFSFFKLVKVAPKLIKEGRITQ